MISHESYSLSLHPDQYLCLSKNQRLHLKHLDFLFYGDSDCFGGSLRLIAMTSAIFFVRVMILVQTGHVNDIFGFLSKVECPILKKFTLRGIF